MIQFGVFYALVKFYKKKKKEAKKPFPEMRKNTIKGTDTFVCDYLLSMFLIERQECKQAPQQNVGDF